MLNWRESVPFAAAFALLLAPGLRLSASSGASEWRVCVHNLAELNPPTLAALNVEASGLLHGRRVSFEQGPCVARSGGLIHLIVRSQAPAGGQDVLGRAPLRQGSVLPVLEVFVEPLLSFIGQVESSKLIGRALARIVAHEVTHFIDQDVTHGGRGLMQASFSGWDLITDDSHRFRRLQAR